MEELLEPVLSYRRCSQVVACGYFCPFFALLGRGCAHVTLLVCTPGCTRAPKRSAGSPTWLAFRH